MAKKAIGKKKVLYRTTKQRYFKLQQGELRYYKDPSYKSSTLKGTVDLSTCPGKAVVTGSPCVTLTVPLPKGMALQCSAASEAGRPAGRAAGAHLFHDQKLHSRQRQRYHDLSFDLPFF